MASNRDLSLNSQEHDLKINKYDLLLNEKRDSIRQRLSVRLRLVLREWFLDLTAGLPYYEVFFDKNPDVQEIEARLRAAILGVPGVLEILYFNLTFNNERRVLTVHFTVSTEEGNVHIDNSFLETI